jgi:hypothetical protein
LLPGSSEQQRFPVGGQLRQFLLRHAQPVHAGIDMKGGIERGVRPLACRRISGDLGQGIQHRDKIVGEQGGNGVPWRAVQHKNSRLGQQGAQFYAFLQPGDKEAAAARAFQRRGHHPGAQAITIRLDHGGNGGRARQGAQGLVIPGDPPQPHGQACCFKVRLGHGRFSVDRECRGRGCYCR